MTQIPFRLLVLSLSLAVAACAGARGPAPAPEAAVPTAASVSPAAPATPPAPPVPVIPVSKQVCGVQEGRTVNLADLGLPEGSRPLGMALTADTVWLLFEPSLLVELPRDMEAPAPVAIPEFGAVEEIDLIPGPAGVAWTALSVDWDGSVWLVSETAPGLWRMRRGRRPEAVRLAGTPAVRQGGFRDVLAGRGSIWVSPACADKPLWRLAPSGKLLGTSWEAAAGSCSTGLVERDWSGTVWALRPEAGELFHLNFDQDWQPAGPGTAPPAPSGSEAVHSWFFWGAEPMGLSADGSLLFRNVGGTVQAFREDCGEGNALVAAAGDERGWAVLTRTWLRLADHRREDGAATQQ